MKKGESVLFLDEIQEYYAVRDKRIKENPKYAEEYVDILALAKPIAEELHSHGYLPYKERWRDRFHHRKSR